MKYPVKKDGDWLIYHRLTGMPSGSSVADVVRAVDNGFILTPFDERRDDEGEAEFFGLDPIDLAAGDGGAVFCTPFQPYITANQKTWMRRAPGVAFRLSHLLRLHQVSVRPTDFQKFYLEIADRPPLHDISDAMRHSVDLYDQEFYLSKLSRAFALVRTAETFDAVKALDAISDGTADQHFGYLDEVPVAEIDAASDEALDFVYEFEEYDDKQFESLIGKIVQSLYGAWTSAHMAWDEVRPNDVEVLVWGSIPLSLAVLVFDDSGFCTPEAARAKGSCR